MERLINASIHELVFAAQHLDQTDPDPRINCTDCVEAAQDCLTTVGLNVEAIQAAIVEATRGEPRKGAEGAKSGYRRQRREQRGNYQDDMMNSRWQMAKRQGRAA